MPTISKLELFVTLCDLDYCITAKLLSVIATGTVGIAVWSVMGAINTILLAMSMIFCRMLSCEAKKQRKSLQRISPRITLSNIRGM